MKITEKGLNRNKGEMVFLAGVGINEKRGGIKGTLEYRDDGFYVMRHTASDEESYKVETGQFLGITTLYPRRRYDDYEMCIELLERTKTYEVELKEAA